MDRGSNMKVGSVTRLRSAPGLSWEIICMSTAAQPPVSLSLCPRTNVFEFTYHCPALDPPRSHRRLLRLSNRLRKSDCLVVEDTRQ
jgi:hypothetical protein